MAFTSNVRNKKGANWLLFSFKLIAHRIGEIGALDSNDVFSLWAFSALSNGE